VRHNAKAAWEQETSSKEREIHQHREKKAQRDEPKGGRSRGEMHSTPEGGPIVHGGVWKSGNNVMVWRFESPGV